MAYLLLAIAFSTSNHLLFKAFARFRIDLLSAIVANYAVCVVIGCSSATAVFSPGTLLAQPWYPLSVVQGGVLVLCFFLLGLTTERQGVAVASLATRLSVTVPTLAAFVLYDDTVSLPKTTGIAAALLALYLSCLRPGRAAGRAPAAGVLPITLFGAFGAHATLLKYVQAHYLGSTSYHAYVMAAFLSAFLVSGSILAWRLRRLRQAGRWRDLGVRWRDSGVRWRDLGVRWQDLASGLVLGCTNYGALYCLVRALSLPRWQSSQLFPTISIAVVGLSTVGAWAIFAERLQRRLLVALAIGAGAIVLINL